MRKFFSLTLVVVALGISIEPVCGQEPHSPKVRKLKHMGTEYWVYRLEPQSEGLQLWLSEQRNQPNKFSSAYQRAQKSGKKLKFAMNAGIYEPGFIPSGLHINAGKTVVKLNRDVYQKPHPDALTPNFFLAPNGVFYQLEDGSCGIIETEAYHKAKLRPQLATQSGPLLLDAGVIHPALSPKGTSKRSRNGVGITKAGVVYFVCSIDDTAKGRTNLHNFTTCFRDALGCHSALYFDGDISQIYIDGKTAVPERDTNWFAGILVITD